VLEELIGEEILDEYDVTGANANPATAYVPPEAQAAVDAAAERKARQSRLTAAVKPALSQMQSAVNAAIPSRMKAFVSIERSRSAPGRTRDAPAAEGEAALEEIGNAVGLAVDEERPAEQKSASSPPTAIMQLPPEVVVPTAAAVPAGQSTVNVTVPAIVVQAEPTSPTPMSPGSRSSSQPPSAIPVHVQMQVPTDPAARRASPAPSLLSEAILLERGRRRAAAAALSGTQTPLVADNGSNPSVATAAPALPTARDVEERLAATGPRARGARYKSSPLVAPEPGKASGPPGTVAAQAEKAGLPPTVERKEG
jgi:hypothetical protein